jgi:hypothetical protein
MKTRIYFGSKLQIEKSIYEEFTNYKLVHSYNTARTVSNYSPLFDSRNIYLHSNPNNDEIKLLENSKAINFIFFDDDSFDGRLSLIQKVKKDGLIFDYSYPVVGDISNLRRIVIKNTSSIKIDNNCWQWIYDNCPIVRIKSKQSGSKKEKLCYDIDLLINDIVKISDITKLLTLDDLVDNKYNNDSDIFAFIDDLLNKKLDKCLVASENLIKSIGEQALLLILLNQLFFLMKVNCAKEKHYNLDQAQKIIDMEDLLGQYFTSDWQEIKQLRQSENPIRVKIEYSKNPIKSEKLATIIQEVVHTIKDLRNMGNSEHSVAYLLHHIASV